MICRQTEENFPGKKSSREMQLARDWGKKGYRHFRKNPELAKAFGKRYGAKTAPNSMREKEERRIVQLRGKGGVTL